jgi:hypothetical protein
MKLTTFKKGNIYLPQNMFLGPYFMFSEKFGDDTFSK